MTFRFLRAFEPSFLDHASTWYKRTIPAFLVIKPCLLNTLGHFVTGWCLVLELMFTLARALKSYPLQSGGLLPLERVLIGLAKPAIVYHEALNLIFPVVLPRGSDFLTMAG